METTEKNCKENTHNQLLQQRHQHTRVVLQRSTAGAGLNRASRSCNNPPKSEQQLKLAAIAIRLNVRLRTADMPVTMQEHALRYTRSLIGGNSSVAVAAAAPPPPQRLSPTLLARFLKKEFDGHYGPAWHCVVGKSFGSFVTHSAGGFVYFSLDSLSVLLFKTEVQIIKNSSSPLP